MSPARAGGEHGYLTTAVMVSVVVAIAAPHAHSAIAALHGEFAMVDALASPAATAQPRAHRHPRWVAIADQTAALARQQARGSAR